MIRFMEDPRLPTSALDARTSLVATMGARPVGQVACATRRGRSPLLRGVGRAVIETSDTPRRQISESTFELATRAKGLDGRFDMLWTIAVILLVLWALGLVSSFTMGGFIHLLLVAAIVVVIIRVIQGRRVL
jgi:hypothetical protein